MVVFRSRGTSGAVPAKYDERIGVGRLNAMTYEAAREAAPSCGNLSVFRSDRRQRELGFYSLTNSAPVPFRASIFNDARIRSERNCLR
jgi:hypothetical protein